MDDEGVERRRAAELAGAAALHAQGFVGGAQRVLLAQEALGHQEQQRRVRLLGGGQLRQRRHQVRPQTVGVFAAVALAFLR